MLDFVEERKTAEQVLTKAVETKDPVHISCAMGVLNRIDSQIIRTEAQKRNIAISQISEDSQSVENRMVEARRKYLCGQFETLYRKTVQDTLRGRISGQTNQKN